MVVCTGAACRGYFIGRLGMERHHSRFPLSKNLPKDALDLIWHSLTANVKS